MTDLADMISASAVARRVKAADSTRAILALCELAASAYGIDMPAALESALERERLGGTGVGDGVAIPHARLRDLSKPVAVLGQFDPPVNFEAPDGRPADIVVLLLSPDAAGADHLKALARLSRVLRRPDMRDSLRGARTAAAMHALLSAESGSARAA